MQNVGCYNSSESRVESLESILVIKSKVRYRKIGGLCCIGTFDNVAEIHIILSATQPFPLNHHLT